MKTFLKKVITICTGSALLLTSLTITQPAFAQSRSYLTRADLVVLVVNALDEDPDMFEYTSCYADVVDDYFSEEVCYASTQGWFTETSGLFRPYNRASASFARRVIARAFNVNERTLGTSRSNTITRSQANQMIERARRYTYNDNDPYYYDNYSPRINSSRLPEGYPDPWNYPYTSVLTPYYDNAYYDPPYSYTPVDNYSYNSCGRSSNRTGASYSVNYCPVDNTGAPVDQILLGQSYFGSINGQSLTFNIPDRMTAMGAAYASEMFNINPNFLMAIALRESRMNCVSSSQGCFNLGYRFNDVRNRYPSYFSSYDSSTLLQNFGSAAVIASLYMRSGERFLDTQSQWRSFYQSANDQEARTKILALAYSKGFNDLGIRSMLQDNRGVCQYSSNIFGQCFASTSIYDSNGSGYDYALAVTSYCQTLMNSGNFFEVRLTRTDLYDFIDRVVRPTFGSGNNINWTEVRRRADDAFSCAQNSTGTISFRYDFKHVLRSIKPLLPTISTPSL